MSYVAALRALGIAVATASAAVTHSLFFKEKHDTSDTESPASPAHPPMFPTRDQMKEHARKTTVDVLVIGGGATGCGVALDANSRGLDVVLVEKLDFASGTSSRSTKLIHGGVRYLEKAVTHLDREQFALVEEALSERETLLRIAPHIARELPIIVPIYTWWKLPYMWAGLKAYDFVAWLSKKKEDVGISSSYLLGPTATLQEYPQLNSKGLKGSIVYHDGQHDDAGMTLAIAVTAATRGAALLNYTKVIGLLKEGAEGSEYVCGAVVEDQLTGETYEIRAKSVVNATGCFTQEILDMDDAEGDKVVAPSKGLHLSLPKYFCPDNLGMLNPETSDGRVLFLLPWEGRAIAGTTDSPTVVSDAPTGSSKDAQWVIDELNQFLSPDVQIRREDVTACWAGIRPLVRKPGSTSTEDIPRTHFVYISDTGLVTIAGGKWTTYRQMAEDTMDEVLLHHPNLTVTSPSKTKSIYLAGGKHYRRTLPHSLVQGKKIPFEVAEHVASRYGDNASHVLDIDPEHNLLVPDFPYLESEVAYAVRYEFALTAVDIVARRTRLAFLDNSKSLEAVDKIVAIMAKELDWSAKRRVEEKEATVAFLKTMALPEDTA